MQVNIEIPGCTMLIGANRMGYIVLEIATPLWGSQ